MQMLLDRCSAAIAYVGLNGMAISRAVSNRHDTIVRMLLQHSSIQLQLWHLQHCLEVAAQSGQISVLVMLLDDGPRCSGLDLRKAIPQACAHGHADIVDLLLDRGAQLQPVVAYVRDNLLDMACLSRSVPMIKLLLRRGPDVYGAGTGAGLEAFHTAVTLNDLNVLAALLDAGFVPDSISIESAARLGLTPVLQTLLIASAQHGPVRVVDLNAALAAAVRNGCSDTALLLLQFGAEMTSLGSAALYGAVCMDSLPTVQLVFQHREITSAELDRMLLLSVSAGSVELTRMLVDRCPDISVVVDVVGACRKRFLA